MFWTPLASAIWPVDTVRVSPTWAVPVTAGWPVAGLLGCSSCCGCWLVSVFSCWDAVSRAMQ